jgi:hypothetical protein
MLKEKESGLDLATAVKTKIEPERLQGFSYRDNYPC